LGRAGVLLAAVVVAVYCMPFEEYVVKFEKNYELNSTE